MKEKTVKINIIPNLFTLANLTFGFLSLVLTMNQIYNWAAGMILLSVLMDSLDGRVARRLAVSSEFGKELDSLSDLVSFGVAPAVLTYQAILSDFIGGWGLLIALLFALCGAIRLARFNLLNITDYFVGVPITFAGGLVAFLNLFSQSIAAGIFAVLMVVLSGLMVSTLHVPKLGK